MPYINQADRNRMEEVEHSLVESGIVNAGELQYVIALAIREYMETHPFRYQTMNDVLGALNGANLEFYRRYVAPYEDKAIRKNGDIEGYGKNNSEDL